MLALSRLSFSLTVATATLALAASASHADPQLVTEFRGGAIGQVQIQTGDPNLVLKVTSPFDKAIHAGYVDDTTGDSFWVIWRSGTTSLTFPPKDAKQVLAVIPEFSNDTSGQHLQFSGVPERGLLAGAQVTGTLSRIGGRQFSVKLQVKKEKSESSAAESQTNGSQAGGGQVGFHEGRPGPFGGELDFHPHGRQGEFGGQVGFYGDTDPSGTQENEEQSTEPSADEDQPLLGEKDVLSITFVQSLIRIDVPEPVRSR